VSYIQIVEYDSDRHADIMAAAAGEVQEAIDRG
jgi:hypothetical protein